MPKRSRPSKGGRTEQLLVRITPANKERIQLSAKLAGMSVADLIAWWISQDDISLPPRATH